MKGREGKKEGKKKIERERENKKMEGKKKMKREKGKKKRR